MQFILHPFKTISDMQAAARDTNIHDLNMVAQGFARQIEQQEVIAAQQQKAAMAHRGKPTYVAAIKRLAATRKTISGLSERYNVTIAQMQELDSVNQNEHFHTALATSVALGAKSRKKTAAGRDMADVIEDIIDAKGLREEEDEVVGRFGESLGGDGGEMDEDLIAEFEREMGMVDASAVVEEEEALPSLPSATRTRPRPTSATGQRQQKYTPAAAAAAAAAAVQVHAGNPEEEEEEEEDVEEEDEEEESREREEDEIFLEENGGIRIPMRLEAGAGGTAVAHRA